MEVDRRELNVSVPLIAAALLSKLDILWNKGLLHFGHK